MKLDVIIAEAGKAGDIDLSDDIFGLSRVRTFCIASCAGSARRRSRAPTSVLGKSDVSY